MLIAILAGPTASGKSALALRLAKANGWALLNADSRQLYRGLEIGTAAPSPAERASVPHLLFGVLDPSEAYSPKRYRSLALASLAQASRPVLAVGGSGLYLRELLFPAPDDGGEVPESVRQDATRRLELEGTDAIFAWLRERDPEGLAGVHPADAYRLQKRLEHALCRQGSYAENRTKVRDPVFANTRLLGIDRARSELHARIEQRLDAMLSADWEGEVESLLRHHLPDCPALTAVGYREWVEFLSSPPGEGKALAASRRDLRASLLAKTRQYAKRQSTYFRSQIPGMEMWDAESLRAALEAVNWNWERFCLQFPDKARTLVADH